MRTSRLLAAAVVLSLIPTALFASAQVVIVNANAPGVGFNDPTPAAPVGGNTGTTLGEQRLRAFQFAADVWGRTLDSSVPILVLSSFEPLTCTATGSTTQCQNTRGTRTTPVPSPTISPGAP